MGSKYKLDKPQLILLAEKSLDFQLYDCKWIPCSAKFLVMGMKHRGTGSVHIYEINDGQPEMVKEIEKPTPFKCGTFNASPLSERNMATGDFEGKLQIWNLQDTYSPVYSVQAHNEIINCIDGVGGRSSDGCGAPEIVTGGKDGSVKVWDPRQKDKAVAQIETAEGENKRECWAVAFGNSYNSEERIVAAGYDNGDLKLFDLKNMSLKWETNLKNGVCSIEFDRSNIPMNKLVATTLESKFFVFDLKTLHKEKGFAYLSEKAHKSTIWNVKHLPQNRDIFVTCGGSGSLNLWQYNYPERRTKEDVYGLPVGVAGNLSLLQESTFSTQPINSLDWSADKLGLGVCTSFDQSFKLFITTKLNLY